MSIVMFDQRGAAFDPVAVVEIFHATEVAHFGGVDMPAHHTIDCPLARGTRDHFLELRDEGDRVLDLVLGVL